MKKATTAYFDKWEEEIAETLTAEQYEEYLRGTAGR